MYVPPRFQVENPELIREIIENFGFAPLITPGPEPSITHLPFMLNRGKGERGTLRGHMARANPHWKAFDRASESVIIFGGPHAYVSPTWYRDEQSVPTWNYAAVHVYGRPQIIEGEAAFELLVDTLEVFEGHGRGYDHEEAKGLIRKMIGGIVAFEIPIERIEAKFKMSQNKSDADRERVIGELAGGSHNDREVAELMKRL